MGLGPDSQSSIRPKKHLFFLHIASWARPFGRDQGHFCYQTAMSLTLYSVVSFGWSQGEGAAGPAPWSPKTKQNREDDSYGVLHPPFSSKLKLRLEAVKNNQLGAALDGKVRPTVMLSRFFGLLVVFSLGLTYRFCVIRGEVVRDENSP